MKTSINQSLAQGLETLLLFLCDADSLCVAEISKKLKYSQGKAYRIVRTLVKYDFLQELHETARYGLGSNALRLGLIAQQQFHLADIARPYMKELSRVTRETALLTAVGGTKGIVLERVESQEPIRYLDPELRPGASMPLHAGASSLILMAHLSEKDWDRIIKAEGLRRYTPNTITNKNRLKIYLKEIRSQGYAFSDQEVAQGVRAIAVPILKKNGEFVAGLSVAGPVFRMSKKKLNSYKKSLMKYATKISSFLG